MLFQFLLFIKNPNFQVQENLNLNSKIRSFVRIYLIFLLGAFLTSIVSRGFGELISSMYGNVNNPLGNYRININELIKFYGFWFYLIGIFWVPILEEMIFRLPIVTSNINFKFASFACIATVLFSFLKHKFQIDINSIIISLFGFLLIAICWHFREKNNNNYRILFYSSSILFGIIHIANFTPLNPQLLLFYPFLVLPQIFMGLIIGYTRVRIGFLWGLILHICINTPFIILQIIKN